MGAWLSGGFWVLLAYLAGSVSFAIVLSKLFGMADPRSYGSNNPGATNMLRSGRKEVALLTLLGDALKGFLPVYLAARWGELSPVALGWVALAAFLGHLYPVFFRFQGGKGVATFLGAGLGLSAQIGLWVILFAAFWGIGWVLLPIMLMVVLMFYRHHSNIQNLLAGKERRLFAPKQ
jgi:glycerol-3-phosphate acyltransferase PlsY